VSFHAPIHRARSKPLLARHGYPESHYAPVCITLQYHISPSSLEVVAFQPSNSAAASGCPAPRPAPVPDNAGHFRQQIRQVEPAVSVAPAIGVSLTETRAPRANPPRRCRPLRQQRARASVQQLAHVARPMYPSIRFLAREKGLYADSRSSSLSRFTCSSNRSITVQIALSFRKWGSFSTATASRKQISRNAPPNLRHQLRLVPR